MLRRGGRRESRNTGKCSIGEFIQRVDPVYYGKQRQLTPVVYQAIEGKRQEVAGGYEIDAGNTMYAGRQCIEKLKGKAGSENDLARAHESVERTSARAYSGLLLDPSDFDQPLRILHRILRNDTGGNGADVNP